MRQRLTILSAVVAMLGIAAAANRPLPTIDQKGYTALVGKRAGHVLVVNMWATWCEPCREEFPDLVKLHDELASRGLDLVAISLDTMADAEGAVIPFLEGQKARFPAYIKTAGDDDAFINAVDTAWSGALPATFVYDARGVRIKTIQGATTYAELKDLVVPLLGASR